MTTRKLIKGIRHKIHRGEYTDENAVKDLKAMIKAHQDFKRMTVGTWLKNGFTSIFEIGVGR